MGERMKIIHAGVLNRGVGGTGCYWPSIARLPDGRLAVVYSGGRKNHVCPFGRVDIAYSTDEGAHWSAGACVLDTPLDDRDAGIVVWGDRVVLTTFNNSIAFQRSHAARWPKDWTKSELAYIKSYLQTISPERERQSLGSLISFSDSGFENFQKVPITAPHGPLSVSDGRLLYIGKAFSADQTWQGGYGDGIYAMWTRDGRNWSPPIALPTAADAELYEPHAVECDDGRILVAIRAHTADGRLTVMLTESSDGGETFAPLRHTGFNGSPPHLLKRKDGTIVMTYGRREHPFGIRARCSRDGGQTWSEEAVLRDDAIDWDMGYPASIERQDGSILTVYYIKACGERLAHIEYTVWTL